METQQFSEAEMEKAFQDCVRTIDSYYLKSAG